jgi:DNA-binding transcriptional LysR family regulator
MSMPYALYGTPETAYIAQHDPAAVGLILMNTAQSHFSDVAWLLDRFPQSRRVFTSTSRAVQAQMCQRGMGIAVLPRPIGDAIPDYSAFICRSRRRPKIYGWVSL